VRLQPDLMIQVANDSCGFFVIPNGQAVRNLTSAAVSMRSATADFSRPLRAGARLRTVGVTSAGDAPDRQTSRDLATAEDLRSQDGRPMTETQD
jgi:hypothetical protein